VPNSAKNIENDAAAKAKAEPQAEATLFAKANASTKAKPTF